MDDHPFSIFFLSVFHPFAVPSFFQHFPILFKYSAEAYKMGATINDTRIKTLWQYKSFAIQEYSTLKTYFYITMTLKILLDIVYRSEWTTGKGYVCRYVCRLHGFECIPFKKVNLQCKDTVDTGCLKKWVFRQSKTPNLLEEIYFIQGVYEWQMTDFHI